MHEENKHMLVGMSLFLGSPLCIVLLVFFSPESNGITEYLLPILIGSFGIGGGYLLYYSKRDRDYFYQNCYDCNPELNKISFIPKSGKKDCKLCNGFGYYQKPNYDELSNA